MWQRMLLQNALNETGNSHHNGTAQHQANIIQHIQRIRYIYVSLVNDVIKTIN